MPSVELLEPVLTGQPLGHIVDHLGVTLAPADGLIALRRELPPVSFGDTVIPLAAEAKR